MKRATFLGCLVLLAACGKEEETTPSLEKLTFPRYVQSLYRDVLKREATQSEVAHATRAYGEDQSVHTIVRGILDQNAQASARIRAEVEGGRVRSAHRRNELGRLVYYILNHYSNRPRYSSSNDWNLFLAYTMSSEQYINYVLLSSMMAY